MNQKKIEIIWKQEYRRSKLETKVLEKKLKLLEARSINSESKEKEENEEKLRIEYESAIEELDEFVSGRRIWYGPEYYSQEESKEIGTSFLKTITKSEGSILKIMRDISERLRKRIENKVDHPFLKELLKLGTRDVNTFHKLYPEKISQIDIDSLPFVLEISSNIICLINEFVCDYISLSKDWTKEKLPDLPFSRFSELLCDLYEILKCLEYANLEPHRKAAKSGHLFSNRENPKAITEELESKMWSRLHEIKISNPGYSHSGCLQTLCNEYKYSANAQKIRFSKRKYEQKFSTK